MCTCILLKIIDILLGTDQLVPIDIIYRWIDRDEMRHDESDYAVIRETLRNILDVHKGDYLILCHTSPAHFLLVMQLRPLIECICPWNSESIGRIANEILPKCHVDTFPSAHATNCSWLSSIYFTSVTPGARPLARIDRQLLVCGCNIATIHFGGQSRVVAQIPIGSAEETRQDALRRAINDWMKTNSTVCQGCVATDNIKLLSRYEALVSDGTAIMDQQAGVIRSVICEFISEHQGNSSVKRCNACTKLYNAEKSRACRKNKTSAAVPSTHASSKTRFDNLSDADKLLRFRNVAKKAAKGAKYQKELVSLKAEIQSKRQRLMAHSFTNAGLDMLMSELYLTEQRKKDSEAALKLLAADDQSGIMLKFWGKQLEYRQRKKDGLLAGMRWDPYSVRIAVAIANRSNLPPQILQQAGILHLPNIRTVKYYVAGAAGRSGMDIVRFTNVWDEFVDFRKRRIDELKKEDGASLREKVADTTPEGM